MSAILFPTYQYDAFGHEAKAFLPLHRRRCNGRTTNPLHPIVSTMLVKKSLLIFWFLAQSLNFSCGTVFVRPEVEKSQQGNLLIIYTNHVKYQKKPHTKGGGLSHSQLTQNLIFQIQRGFYFGVVLPINGGEIA